MFYKERKKTKTDFVYIDVFFQEKKQTKRDTEYLSGICQ